jgi:hypothetical protein
MVDAQYNTVQASSSAPIVADPMLTFFPIISRLRVTATKASDVARRGKLHGATRRLTGTALSCRVS